MKPYGRDKHVSGGNDWKRDYHIHQNGRKVENWWEGICCHFPRSTVKMLYKKDINREIINGKEAQS